MQSILNDYEEKNKGDDGTKYYWEDDYADIGDRIKDAFGDLGSVTSVARDVLRMKSRRYDDDSSDDDSSDDDYSSDDEYDDCDY